MEKGEHDEIVGKLDAVLWRRDDLRIRRLLTRSGGQEIAEGQLIRCRVNLDIYPPTGRLQLAVRDVDPVFSLGVLAQRREETLADLASRDLLDRNRKLELPALPLRIGLVTSRESAAYEDFVTTLRESGFAFRIAMAHAAVQGREAETQVALALTRLASVSLDCCAVVRGGGSRSDLAAFDSRRIAECIARAPFPVLTGLGHQIDDTIADRVAHTFFKTPTKTAEFLVERVAAMERRLAALRERLPERSGRSLEHARQELRRCESGVQSARHRLAHARARLDGLARGVASHSRRRLRGGKERWAFLRQRLAAVAPRQLARRSREPEELMRRLVDGAKSRLRGSGRHVDALARLSHQLSPRRTLERGFSLTRDENGKLIRRAETVQAGERVHTELASGSLVSRVEPR